MKYFTFLIEQLNFLTELKTLVKYFPNYSFIFMQVISLPMSVAEYVKI